MRRLRKSLIPQNYWKTVIYLTLINSKWAALDRVVIERAIGEWRQRPPLAFMLEKDILSTCCNKDDVM